VLPFLERPAEQRVTVHGVCTPITTSVISLFAQGSEARANLLAEELRLLPGGKVPASVELVVMNELGVGSFRPTPRGRIDVVRKGAHGDGYGDPFRGEKAELVFPINTRRRNRRIRQPVQRDVVEDIVV